MPTGWAAARRSAGPGGEGGGERENGMLIAIAFAVGFGVGWIRATRRGGTIPDRIQYGLAHGIPAALVAVAAIVIAARIG